MAHASGRPAHCLPLRPPCALPAGAARSPRPRRGDAGNVSAPSHRDSRRLASKARRETASAKLASQHRDHPADRERLACSLETRRPSRPFGGCAHGNELYPESAESWREESQARSHWALPLRHTVVAALERAYWVGGRSTTAI